MNSTNMDMENLNVKVHLSEWRESDKKAVERPFDIKQEIPDLETLIQELHKIFSYNNVNIQDVQNLMSRYKSDRSHWKNYAKFDRFKYTRNLIDAGNGAFNIMILCWGTNHASPIHDHADSHCFMKLLEGSLEEVRYDWPENVLPEFKKVQEIKQSDCQPDAPQNDTDCQNDSCQIRCQSDSSQITSDSCQEVADICSRTTIKGGDKCKPGNERRNVMDAVEIGRNILQLNDVCYINDALGLHKMENPSDTNVAVSLHLYCPPFNACQTFDDSGKPSVAPVTFWSIKGKKVERTVPGNK